MNRRHIIIVAILLVASAIRAQELVRVEYFFDTDPGYGNGIPLAQPVTGENNYEMSFESVTPGYHLLCIRAQDKDGRWSATTSRPLYVINPVDVTEIEYFFDKDPGEGNAVAITVPENLSEPFAFEVASDQLEAGEHLLCVRAKGSDGIWTLVSSQAFTVNTSAGDANGDGVVNAADIVEVVNYIKGISSDKFDASAADVNGDGNINIADVICIANIILAK